MRMIDIHWLAGLLEGEGSFTCGSSLTIRVGMTDEDIVRRASEILDGSFSTTGRLTVTGKTVYQCYLHGSGAYSWMITLYLLMGKRRKEQIKTAVRQWFAKPGPSKGEQNAAAKLTTNKVKEIRRRVSGGTSHQKVADSFRVSRSTVGRIVNRDGWKHVL